MFTHAPVAPRAAGAPPAYGELRTDLSHQLGEGEMMCVCWCQRLRGHAVLVDTIDSDFMALGVSYLAACSRRAPGRCCGATTTRSFSCGGARASVSSSSYTLRATVWWSTHSGGTGSTTGQPSARSRAYSSTCASCRWCA